MKVSVERLWEELEHLSLQGLQPQGNFQYWAWNMKTINSPRTAKALRHIIGFWILMTVQVKEILMEGRNMFHI